MDLRSIHQKHSPQLDWGPTSPRGAGTHTPLSRNVAHIRQPRPDFGLGARPRNLVSCSRFARKRHVMTGLDGMRGSQAACLEHVCIMLQAAPARKPSAHPRPCTRAGSGGGRHSPSREFTPAGVQAPRCGLRVQGRDSWVGKHRKAE